MAADSNTNGDVFVWIKEVINSCNTIDQLKGAKNLIVNFSIILPSKEEYFKALIDPLWDFVYIKEDEINLNNYGK